MQTQGGATGPRVDIQLSLIKTGIKSKMLLTVCTRGLDPFYILSYYINWGRNFWAYSIITIIVEAEREGWHHGEAVQLHQQEARTQGKESDNAWKLKHSIFFFFCHIFKNLLKITR